MATHPDANPLTGLQRADEGPTLAGRSKIPHSDHTLQTWRSMLTGGNSNPDWHMLKHRRCITEHVTELKRAAHGFPHEHGFMLPFSFMTELRIERRASHVLLNPSSSLSVVVTLPTLINLNNIKEGACRIPSVSLPLLEVEFKYDHRENISIFWLRPLASIRELNGGIRRCGEMVPFLRL